MVLCGIGLLSKPLWVDILNVALGGFKLSIIGEFDWLLGLIVIMIALFYNTYHRHLDLDFEKLSKPAYEDATLKKFHSFGKLCQELLPIMKDNKYIFITTGPNGSEHSVGELRNDLTVWNRLKLEAIKPNNETLKKLIKTNIEIIPEIHKPIFYKLLAHIDAFEEHISNPDFDYSNHQFPVIVKNIVEHESFQHAKTDVKLIKIRNWLKNRLDNDLIVDWMIIGSMIFNPEKANDTDIAILIDSNILNNSANFIDNLKFDFKIKFKLELHISVFSNQEKNDFELFEQRNPLKIK